MNQIHSNKILLFIFQLVSDNLSQTAAAYSEGSGNDWLCGKQRIQT